MIFSTTLKKYTTVKIKKNVWNNKNIFLILIRFKFLVMKYQIYIKVNDFSATLNFSTKNIHHFRSPL